MKKKFDCVKMKHNIQEQLDKEMKGISLDERFYYLKNKPITSPILLKFINRMKKKERTKATSVVAESQARYETD
ncbi:MAG: hypothetical protein U9O87_10825 [Verrucomicrobiota bacterium]|nr:hypothetical protein [Verrucomicrobiota bacterium]